MNNQSVKVLNVINNLGTTGIGSFVVNINEHLKDVKYDYFILNDGKSIFDNRIYNLNSRIKKVNVDKINFFIFRIIKRVICFHRFLNSDIKYDIVVFHMSLSSNMLIYIICARLNKLKTIILHSHNTNIEKANSKTKLRIFTHKLCKLILHKVADYFFACSLSAGKWMYTKNILNSNKFKVINNGIDVNKFTFNQPIYINFRKKLNLENKFVIGNVGRFVYQKNHTFLIDVFKEIHKINKNSVLLLIGEGELENAIRKKIKSLKLDNAVIFIKSTDDINMYLQVMDIFLLPSKFEGLPIVAIEAQATGLKCFLSNTITKECNITGLVRFISLNKSPKYWANIILKLGINYKRKSFKTKIIYNGYSIKNVAYNLEKFYIFQHKLNIMK